MQAQAANGIVSCRPEWPCVTRVTIATSRLPANPDQQSMVWPPPKDTGCIVKGGKREPYRSPGKAPDENLE